LSASESNADWLAAQQAEFAARTGAAVAFWPELKASLAGLVEAEPFRGRVKLHVSEDEPLLLTLTAGLFDLKFAADLPGDRVFYAFTSALLKKVIPLESAIFHYGQLQLSRGPWGVIDNPGPEVHQVFVDAPQGVQHFPLADQVARWSLEQLLGGYPKIAALESAAVQKKAEAAKKEAKNGSATRG
jgi:hypothetical protein